MHQFQETDYSSITSQALFGSIIRGYVCAKTSSEDSMYDNYIEWGDVRYLPCLPRTGRMHCKESSDHLVPAASLESP